MLIICKDGHILTGSNLHAALLHLRYPDRTRTLWIDAICINQANITERGRQVGMMKDIYRSATRVVIWLGDERDDSPLSMEIAKEIAASAREYIKQGGSVDSHMTDKSASAIFSRFRLDSEHPRLAAFGEILQRDWFYRIWIVQESAVASRLEIRCGGDTMSWVDFVNAIKVQDHLNLFLSDHATNAGIFNLLRARDEFQSGTPHELLSILYRHRAALATNPRDKI